MGVTNLHPLYEKRSSQWRIIRDCVEGEDEIKRAGEAYLPKHQALHLSNIWLIRNVPDGTTIFHKT